MRVDARSFDVETGSYCDLVMSDTGWRYCVVCADQAGGCLALLANCALHGDNTAGKHRSGLRRMPVRGEVRTA